MNKRTSPLLLGEGQGEVIPPLLLGEGWGEVIPLPSNGKETPAPNLS
jgi:hypothetical protein